jgi:hypothetical protein
VNWRWLTALLFVCALGLAALAVVVAPDRALELEHPEPVDVAPAPSRAPEGPPAIPTEGREEGAEAPDLLEEGSEAAPEILVGPNGQPLPPGTRRPQSGLPDRGPPQPPLNDAEEWERVRAEAARVWRKQSFEVATRFAEEQGLDEAEQDGMFAALETYHDDLEAVRADIEAGRTRPAEGRETMGAIRAQVAADLSGVLGSERTEELRRALSVLHGGGF